MKGGIRLVRRLVAMSFLLLTVAWVVRCGRENSKKEDGQKTPVVPTDLPTDWDGVSDWSHSVFEVADA